MSLHQSSISTVSTQGPDPFWVRLSAKAVEVKKIKTADDALVTTLDHEALNWIKSHRKSDSNEKVALSHAHERQLREIFNGLDIDGCGIINLESLQEAAKYVEESTKGKVGAFTNIQQMFESMDEDGNGEVDFHEFTTAMTGTSKSAMSNMSESDIARMNKKFVEFANLRRRDHAISSLTKKGSGEYNDLERYKCFQILFDATATESTNKDNKSSKKSKSTKQKKPVTTVERNLKSIEYLNEMFDEIAITNTLNATTLNTTENTNTTTTTTTTTTTKGSEYDDRLRDLHDRIRIERISSIESLKLDPEKALQQQKFDEELNFLLEIKRKDRERMKSKGGSDQQQQKSINSTLIPVDESYKHDLYLRRRAKEDAYRVLGTQSYFCPRNIQGHSAPSTAQSNRTVLTNNTSDSKFNSNGKNTRVSTARTIGSAKSSLGRDRGGFSSSR
jgi:hypothetical protein